MPRTKYILQDEYARCEYYVLRDALEAAYLWFLNMVIGDIYDYPDCPDIDENRYMNKAEEINAFIHEVKTSIVNLMLYKMHSTNKQDGGISLEDLWSRLPHLACTIEMEECDG